ncbi:MAG: SDR family oxidoreductase [bacterium]|nr:SDR family oxidoreductase [bacterium]
MNDELRNVLVTGGAGYVGAVLVPKLLEKGYHVKVLDLYIYGEAALDFVSSHPNLEQVKGDLRDKALVERELEGIDAVLHLACISNDPSFELNPGLGKAINYDASVQLIDLAVAKGVKRFIFASSSSVYGVKDVPDVTEEMPMEPLTDYSKYKALIEEYLLGKTSGEFTPLIIRPATVCGYSPRQRLDLTVNILTNHAINKGKITVFGGEQKRPNIHIEDITDLYVKSLEYPNEKIAGKIYNAGYENHKVKEIAAFIRERLGKDVVEVVTESSDDNRSYHISSEKIKKELGFVPAHTIEEAVNDLKEAFAAGKLPGSMTDIRYFNIKTMQAINLK